MKTLVLGAGMLAWYLRNFDLSFASKSPKDWTRVYPLDIRRPEEVDQAMQKLEPDVIINTAVMGDIMLCEKNQKEAEDVNHQAQRKVIAACNKHGVRMIYLSTSSVFDGGAGNFREEDETRPGTIYGQTKLSGEQATREMAEDWAIFRISALFGNYPYRKDFIAQIAHRFRNQERYSFWDQVISLSYGPFVATTIMDLVKREVSGIWHIVSDTPMSRYEIGKAVQHYIGKGEVAQSKTPAHLPQNRSLCVDKLKTELPGLGFPDFQDCLRKVLPEAKM